VKGETNMSKVTAYLSLSLDGYIAGPNVRLDNPLGDGGEQLHEWVVGLAGWREAHGLEGGERNGDSEVVATWRPDVGAYVMGRGMFDGGEEPWGDEPPFHKPVFVVTHRARATVEKAGGTTYTFVTDGVASAIARARAAAGARNVVVAGGASVVQQCLKLGLLDELQLHLVPLLLGAGTRLLDGLGPDIKLESTQVVSASPAVTHLRFRVVKEAA
jgi:dihydrofolate reductase